MRLLTAISLLCWLSAAAAGGLRMTVQRLPLVLRERCRPGVGNIRAKLASLPAYGRPQVTQERHTFGKLQGICFNPTYLHNHTAECSTGLHATFIHLAHNCGMTGRIH